jgi:hypothetical protein
LPDRGPLFSNSGKEETDMKELRGKLSEILEIAYGGGALLLMAAFFGACILTVLCVLIGAVAYACVRLRIETIAQSVARWLSSARKTA